MDEFLVSVADAILRDPDTLEALAIGRANLSSAFTLTTQATQVRGGINNPLRYVYMHDRDLKVEVKQVTFGKTILGLNVGSLITNSAVTVVKSECIQLTAGVGTITETPLGNVTVFLNNNTSQTVTPATKTITVSGGANQMVWAVYEYTDTVDQIAIETTKPPSVVNLTLTAEVRDNSNVIQEYLQITVPKFQVDGNYTLSLTANGVSEESLTGFALAETGLTCAANDIYAYVNWIPSSTATATAYTNIVTLPSAIAFSEAAGTPQTYQISSYGLRGITYAPVNITTSCVYTKTGTTAGSAHISVGSSSGLVTLTSGSNGDAALITATYPLTSGSLTDDTIITVGA